jgi:hypothetical protein
MQGYSSEAGAVRRGKGEVDEGCDPAGRPDQSWRQGRCGERAGEVMEGRSPGGGRVRLPEAGHSNCVIAEGDPAVLLDGVPVAFEGTGRVAGRR